MKGLKKIRPGFTDAVETKVLEETGEGENSMGIKSN